ncbi:hypothetical protein N7541_002831 [Penicillium brevicompactum]|uniref:Immunoglobulin variable region used by the itc63b heavy chain n=1 Tax=Penicillium brevicompactum TaxID=5074 RepID=A0A9W9RKL9_PENBR|nr:hypothetical protein N7541_002831 [Penicillium brevicompactum]
MGDAARPSEDEFGRVLQESLKIWSTYLDARSEDRLLPRHAIDLRPVVSRTPPFLGGGLAGLDKTASFDSEEKQSSQSQGSLFVNGRSTWRTSKGGCDLQPRIMPKQLLLGVGIPTNVTLSEDSHFSDWPGAQGLPGHDKGNYLSVLYLAWAYILSARWVELLDTSADHECHMAYTSEGASDSLPQSNKQSTIEIDIGDNVCEQEAFWWRSILCSDGWDASVKYNDRIYLSPWLVSISHGRFNLTTRGTLDTESSPPGSVAALKYLSRFCVHHSLYAQCSVALAGVLFIPLTRQKKVSLPLPKRVPPLQREESASNDLLSIPDLLNQHGELLPKYMTLSSNAWGVRSLLCSTFFNPDIECNLVSAWLNPAFAVLESIRERELSVATLLANRQPRLGILWLGATLAGLATPFLRDIRTGMTALDLAASAWAGTTSTFLTSEMGTNHGNKGIRRDDECRLLFITGSEGHHRPPVWPWKPFGRQPPASRPMLLFIRNEMSIAANHYNYDLFSQSLSEGATRGIFEWLRSTGYPSSERPIYQHSWLDLEDTDEEEADDAESDLEAHQSSKKTHVEWWLENVG